MAHSKRGLRNLVLSMMLASSLSFVLPEPSFAKTENTSKKTTKKATSTPEKKKALDLGFDTSLHGDYARITLKSKDMPIFDVAQTDKTITLNFESAYQGDTKTLTQKLAPFITAAQLSEDGKKLSLTTDQRYAQRPFMSEDGSGIDVMNIDASRSAPLSDTPKEEVKPTEPTVEAKAEPQAAPTQTDAEKEADKALENINKKDDVAKQTQESTPATPTPSSAKTDTSKDTAQTDTASAVAEKTPEPTTDSAVVAAPVPEVKASSDDMETITSASQQSALKNLKDGEVLIGVKKGHGGAQFSFPWSKRVAAATYMRGKNLWIVFNEAIDPHIDILKTVLPPFIDEVEHIPVAGHTVLRMHSNLEMFASAQRKRDSYEWVITMSRRGRIPATIIPIKLQGKEAGRPYFQVDMLQAAEPVEIPDSVVGDKLLVLPDYEPSKGVFPPRYYVDFKLLRTAQGLVIERLNDATRVVKLRSGLKINTGIDKLTLSEEMPEIAMARAASDEENANTFYPYDHWRQNDYDQFLKKRQQLASDIIQATDEDAVKHRMELAGLLLGNDLYSEALGQLNEIKNRQPKFYDDYQLAALRGAANFMIQRYADAAADFSDATLDNEEEISFWKNAALIMQGQTDTVLDYMGFHSTFAKLYPPKMRQRLAMLAADQAMTRTRYNDAKRIVTLLFNESPNINAMDPYLRDYIDFSTGRIYASTGKLDAAREILTEVKETTKNPYFYANATLFLSLAEYEAGKITRKQLIKQLDPLRIVWRGDALEVTLLNLLGDLQVQEGMNIDGMRTWNELVKQYPDAPEALDVAQKMAETFVKLFNEGEADRMKPLEALALYYEFQTLTPVGKDGDKMIQNLADRLASVDLLDRAAALLVYQTKYRLEKEERSRVGARLALLYLLNKEPLKSLESLKLTGYGNNPEELNLQRTHLAAEAYRQSNDTATALRILEGDFSDDAKNIKMSIYWDTKDWKKVAETAEDILANRKDITAPLSDAEAQTLLRLAVSYTFQDDNKQLSYLRDYFTPLMEKSPLKESFAFITNDNGPITHNTLDKLSDDLNKMKSFVEKYQNDVHNTGLSKAVK